MLVTAGTALLGQVLSLFGAKGKATAEDMKARVESMGRSWTDEFLVVVWFSPIAVMWFSPEKANAYITNLTAMPEWYVGILYLITGAVFGLGKLQKP